MRRSPGQRRGAAARSARQCAAAGRNGHWQHVCGVFAAGAVGRAGYRTVHRCRYRSGCPGGSAQDGGVVNGIGKACAGAFAARGDGGLWWLRDGDHAWRRAASGTRTPRHRGGRLYNQRGRIAGPGTEATCVAALRFCAPFGREGTWPDAGADGRAPAAGPGAAPG